MPSFSLPSSARALLLLISTAALGTALSAFPTPPQESLRALDGEWVYLEDRTADRPLEQQGPPMSAKFSFRVEENAVVLVSGHGAIKRDTRLPLDGTVVEIPGSEETVRLRGAWKDGTFTYEVEFIRGGQVASKHQREFRVTPEGLVVKVAISPYAPSTAIYRHPQDIPLPTPAKATLKDLSWLVGDWVGSRGTGGTTTFEERWSPALGGAMLAVSRTVSRDRMTAFEYLRIVERDGGLVYIAQPNGAAPTEFVLTELGANRAVFENPRHDYPKRIVYELTAEGGLSAIIGLSKGGTPRRFDFKREGG